MSEYRVELKPMAVGYWDVRGMSGEVSCTSRADAERIARALRLLDEAEADNWPLDKLEPQP